MHSLGSSKYSTTPNFPPNTRLNTTELLLRICYLLIVNQKSTPNRTFWQANEPVLWFSAYLIITNYFSLVFRLFTFVRSMREYKSLRCYKRTPFAILVLNGFVEIRSYLYSYGSRLKVHYFVINNSRSNGKFVNLFIFRNFFCRPLPLFINFLFM